MSVGAQWQTHPAARLYALDYDLKAISSLLTRVARADGSWAYVVERSGADAGVFIGSTHDAKLDDGHGGRLSVKDSSATSIRESALLLEPNEWPQGYYQRFDAFSFADTRYHECYLKLKYENCAVPLEQQYVAWTSDDPNYYAASGPARCPDGSTSCIIPSVDFGGNLEGCGNAPVMGIATNSAEWVAPGWFSGPVSTHMGLSSAEGCQAICQGFTDADGNACEYFSYEWEAFTSFEVITGIFTGTDGTLDWLIVHGQDIHCSNTEVWSGGGCLQCGSGTQPNSRGNQCVNCPTGRAGTSGACRPCAAGTVPNGQSSRCESCELTQTSLAEKEACFACPEGRIGSTRFDSPLCQDCHIGFFSLVKLAPMEPCQ